jgi:cytochrome c1
MSKRTTFTAQGDSTRTSKSRERLRRVNVLTLSGAMVVLAAACSAAGTGSSAGDPKAGAVAISRNACGSCHQIPGIEGADGRVGPPLTHFRARQMVAGTLPNTLANLRRYLKHPEIVGDSNVMPNQGLTDRQVVDVAAYLYTLD